MLLYTNSLSIRAIIPSSIILELFPARFPCNITINLSHNSLGSDDNHLAFQKHFFL